MTTLSSLKTFFPQLREAAALIQVDNLKPGNILVSVENSLVSVPLTENGVAEVIVGNGDGSSKAYNSKQSMRLLIKLIEGKKVREEGVERR